jgi:hypothetical protein
MNKKKMITLLSASLLWVSAAHGRFGEIMPGRVMKAWAAMAIQAQMVTPNHSKVLRVHCGSLHKDTSFVPNNWA